MRDHHATTVLKLAYCDEAVASEQSIGIEQAAGVNYLTFYLEDLSQVKKKILAAGISVVGEVEREKYALQVIWDPDGVFVEVVEQNKRSDQVNIALFVRGSLFNTA